MRVRDLFEVLKDCPLDGDVTLRTVEHGEVCLTVELTEARFRSNEHDLLLVGDLDVINTRN